MIVEYLPIDFISPTWSLREPNWHGLAAKERLSVWELSGLKEDGFLGVLLPHDAVGFLSHREKLLFIKLCGLSEKTLFFIDVGWPWFIKDVITDHIRILAEFLRHDLPVSK